MKSVHFVGSYYIGISKCTVQKRKFWLWYCYLPLLLCDGIAAHIYAVVVNRTSIGNIIHCRDLRHDRRGTGSPSMV